MDEHQKTFLKSITTRNFKNIAMSKGGVSLSGLNIFIGANGSGKSNFISILRFLRECLFASPAEERGISSFEEASANFGGPRILDCTQKRPASVSLNFEFSPSEVAPKGGELDLSMLVDGNKLYINEEVLRDAQSEDRPFIYYRSHERKSGTGVVSVYKDKNCASSRFQPLVNVPTDKLTLEVIPTLLEKSEYPPEQTPVYQYRRELMDHISQWRFYNANDMNLYDIRHAAPKLGPSDKYLAPSGENLALVFDNLAQEDFEFEQRINNAMNAVLPSTKRIRAVRSGRLSLAIEWYRNGAEEPFYLDEMSDGTVRMLCWAVILHSKILPPLLVIDEPELSLHPAWMPILAEWIKEASRKSQIIVCTHSPDLLDHFTDCSENVFCFCHKDSNHFSINTLPQAELALKIKEGWQLGDLYRVGDPSVGGWPW